MSSCTCNCGLHLALPQHSQTQCPLRLTAQPRRGRRAGICNIGPPGAPRPHSPQAQQGGPGRYGTRVWGALAEVTNGLLGTRMTHGQTTAVQLRLTHAHTSSPQDPTQMQAPAPHESAAHGHADVRRSLACQPCLASVHRLSGAGSAGEHAQHPRFHVAMARAGGSPRRAHGHTGRCAHAPRGVGSARCGRSCSRSECHTRTR